MSATEKVTSTPELMAAIFLCSETQTNMQSCLYVCKMWSEEVLKIEWRVVENPSQLFSLLGMPTKSVTEQGNVALPTPSHWTRFDKYAQKVKKLNIPKSRGYGPNDFVTISSYRQAHMLLPNLQTLLCYADPHIIDAFLHGGVTTIAINDLAVKDSEPFMSMPQSLLQKSPALRFLSIDASWIFQSDERFESALVSMLPSLQLLELVKLPPHCLSEPVCNVLATLPKLISVRSRTADNRLVRPIATMMDHATFIPLSEDNFPSLHALEMAILFTRATEILGSGNWDRMYRLRFHSHAADEEPRALQGLIQTISDTCSKRLVELHLDGRCAEQGQSLRFKDIEPLFACRYLQNLHLIHGSVFRLTEDDVLNILGSLPILTKLYLNPDPIQVSSSEVPLSFLSTLAEKYPSRLEELGLAFSIRDDKTFGFKTGIPDLNPNAVFTRLKVLTIPSPDITLPIPLAVYLAHTTPDFCDIRCARPEWMWFPKKDEEMPRIFVEYAVSLVPNIREKLREGPSGRAWIDEEHGKDTETLDRKDKD